MYNDLLLEFGNFIKIVSRKFLIKLWLSNFNSNFLNKWDFINENIYGSKRWEAVIIIINDKKLLTTINEPS